MRLTLLCLTTLLFACVTDDPVIDEAFIVLGPDASEPTTNVGGAENCPPDQAERPGGCTGEGGGGGTGGGDPPCEPGTPGCHGPVRPPTPSWCATGYPVGHQCCYFPRCDCPYDLPPGCGETDDPIGLTAEQGLD